MYGNHHDAWVNGAADPGSGAAALLETARSLAELSRKAGGPSGPCCSLCGTPRSSG